jgi:hypothetical protein
MASGASGPVSGSGAPNLTTSCASAAEADNPKQTARRSEFKQRDVSRERAIWFLRERDLTESMANWGIE